MRLLWLSLALAVLLVFPAGASAAKKLTVGISENDPAMFRDPYFAGLGTKHARLVVSWNVMTRRGSDEIDRVSDYLFAARQAGVQPLVTFEHARGNATICNKRRNRRKAQCRLPSARQYRRNITLFRNHFPFVRNIVPWNEINHFTQPTYRKPKAAARFTKIARKVFRGRTVLAADILDQADRTNARRPTYRSLKRYVKRFRRAYKGPRKICGIHNYSDVNRFRAKGTRAIIKALGCRQIWFTEAGGIFKFGRAFKASQKRQVRATRFMFRLARKTKKVKRLFVYSYFGGVTQRFDAGLVANGKPRRAYRLVQKQVRRRR